MQRMAEYDKKRQMNRRIQIRKKEQAHERPYKIMLTAGTGVLLSVSSYAALRDSLKWALLAEVLIFVLVGAVPVCRRKAGLWILVMTAIVMIPVNLRAGFWVSAFIFGEAGINAFLTFVQFSFVFESLEIILFVLLGTILFDREKLKADYGEGR